MITPLERGAGAKGGRRRRMMAALQRSSVVAALAALAMGTLSCASSPAPGPGAESAFGERPERQRGAGAERATPVDLPGSPHGLALPVYRVERAATRALGTTARVFEQTADPWRAVDLPRPKRRRGPGRRVVDRVAVRSQREVAGRGAPPPPAAPTAQFGFASTSIDDVFFATSPPGIEFVPPDPHAAVGRDDLVNVVNVVLRIHAKDAGGALRCESDLASFFAALGPLDNFDLFDPKVLYDQHAERFVVVALEQTPSPERSRLLIAVSDDGRAGNPGQPCGLWYQAAIDSNVLIGGSAHWADYPGLAVDGKAVYVTANMFDFAAGSLGGVRLWTVEKTNTGDGGWYGAGSVAYFEDDPYAAAGVATTTQPAHVFGEPATPVGTWLVSYATRDCLVSPPAGCDPCASGGDRDEPELVQLVRIDDPLSMGPTFTLDLVPVTDLETLGACPELPLAPQAGSATGIEVNDRRMLAAVWSRERLYLTGTIDPKSGMDAGQATAHWWSIDTAALDSPTLAEEGSIGGEDIAAGAATYFAAPAVNAAGDLAIGFSASAPTIHAGSYHMSRRAGGALSGAATVQAGLDVYVQTLSGTKNRWGDYSSMVVDPVDQCFWAYNQHALCIDSSGGDVAPCPLATPANNGRWGTAVAYFCVDCEPSPLVLTAPVSGTESRRAGEIRVVGATVAGDLTLEGQLIVLDEGVAVSGSLVAVTGFCPRP